MAGNLSYDAGLEMWAYYLALLGAIFSVIMNMLLARRLLSKAQELFWEDPSTSWCLSGLSAEIIRNR